VDCNAGPASDKPAFAAFVKELREAFNPKGWLLTAAVSPSKAVIDAGYDIPSLSRDLDWIGVMTYDYHGHWDKKTGHVAPLGFHSEADVAYFNTEYTLNYWIRGGADPGKVIMGIPLYGQSFTLENPSNNGLNAPAKGTGSAGEFTRQAGFLAYYEVYFLFK
jgi:chitinase